MAITFQGKRILCGNEHDLIVEEPPQINIRQFYSWTQNGIVEIFGGRGGRPLVIYCWIHDSSFRNYSAIDNYMKSLDQRAGEFGQLRVSTTVTGSQSVAVRDNCRFIGFRRTGFPGQSSPQPILAIGTFDTTAYGSWHIAGELHFYQLKV